jgi:RNA polymerase sigma-70 factor (ECF subfamily)
MSAPASPALSLPRLEQLAMHNPGIPDASATLSELFLSYSTSGDPIVLDQIISQVIEPSLQLAQRISGDRHLAEDAVQEACMRLVRTAHTYDGAVAFEAWMGRLVCAAAIDQRRRARRPRAFAKINDGTHGEQPSRLSQEQEAETVRRALDDLPDCYRMPLMLHYLDARSVEDIAKTLNLPEGTVKTHLTRGRERLREKLQRLGVGAQAAGAMAILSALPATGAASQSLKHAVAGKSLLSAKTAIGATAGIKTVAWIAAGSAILGGWLAAHRPSAKPPGRIVDIQAPAPSLDNGLVGHWTLDDGEGSIAKDSSGLGHDGLFKGKPVWTKDGKSGGGAQFNADGAHIEIQNSPRLEDLQPRGTFSISAWFKPHDASPSGIVMKSAAAGLTYADQRFSMNYYQYLPTRSQMVNRGYAWVSSDQLYPVGEFHHVVGVVSSRTTTLYVNGTAKTIPWSEPDAMLGLGPYTWKLGVGQSFSESFDNCPASGVIDEVRIYDRALTAAEVLALMRVGR